MGVFEELDLANASDDPWQVPDNSYLTTVTKSEVGPNNAGDKTGWSLTYTIVEGERMGEEIREWKQMTPKTSRTRAFVKERLLSLGIPHEQHNTVEPADLKGKENVIVTIKNRKVFSVKYTPDAQSGNGNLSGLGEFAAKGGLDI